MSTTTRKATLALLGTALALITGCGEPTTTGSGDSGANGASAASDDVARVSDPAATTADDAAEPGPDTGMLWFAHFIWSLPK